MTFTPDSRFMYVACAGAAVTEVIDTRTLEKIARIPVGEVPKRVVTAMLPQ